MFSLVRFKGEERAFIQEKLSSQELSSLLLNLRKDCGIFIPQSLQEEDEINCMDNRVVKEYSYNSRDSSLIEDVIVSIIENVRPFILGKYFTRMKYQKSKLLGGRWMYSSGTEIYNGVYRIKNL